MPTGDNSPDNVAVEYVEVNENFRMLADIRFKLLALVPALGGAAIYILTPVSDPAKMSSFDFARVVLVGAMGFLATLGVTFYDQRNSELYNALSDRAKFLEGKLKLPSAAEAPDQAGGQFLERPGRGRRLLGFLKLGHDSGLALIYGVVLGGWFFPVTYAAAYLAWTDADRSLTLALRVTVLAVVVAVEELLRLDGFWRRLRRRLRGWLKRRRELQEIKRRPSRRRRQQ